jgi:hypothetical protein
MTPYAGQRVLNRLKGAIAELGYEAVIEDLSSPDEHREELRAHDQNGTRFVFVLVGVPDRILGPVPVELG